MHGGAASVPSQARLAATPRILLLIRRDIGLDHAQLVPVVESRGSPQGEEHQGGESGPALSVPRRDPDLIVVSQDVVGPRSRR